jgi:hypothetical protein
MLRLAAISGRWFSIVQSGLQLFAERPWTLARTPREGGVHVGFFFYRTQIRQAAVFRFTVRELVLAIALVAIVAAWFMDRLTLSDALQAAPVREAGIEAVKQNHP